MLWDQKRAIVVTGGAGFIGSCVIKHLNERGIDEIYVVDDLGNDEKWKNLVGKRYIDIIEISAFFNWLEGSAQSIGAYIHLGACSSTVEKDADFLLRNNYKFTQGLAALAQHYEQRFIYASSAATYGDGLLGFNDDHALLPSLQPLNMYGYSKHLFDLWAHRTGMLDDIVGLKYFNVFGPNEYHKGRMASALTHMLPTALNEGKVKLFKSSEPDNFADGGQMRDFIYVKDVARMTCDFLFNDLAGIYNIGMGTGSTWNEMAKALFKAIDKPASIEYIPMPSDLIGKYQNYTCADMSKLRSTGFDTTTYPFQDAVIEYVRDYLRENKTW